MGWGWWGVGVMSYQLPPEGATLVSASVWSSQEDGRQSPKYTLTIKQNRKQLVGYQGLKTRDATPSQRSRLMQD